MVDTTVMNMTQHVRDHLSFHVKMDQDFISDEIYEDIKRLTPKGQSHINCYNISTILGYLYKKKEVIHVGKRKNHNGGAPFWIYRKKPKIPVRKVVCAAIKYKNLTYCGARHGDCFRMMFDSGLDPVVYKPQCVQGFIDQFNEFMTREEALKVAYAACQITNKSRPLHKLFSEDLY